MSEFISATADIRGEYRHTQSRHPLYVPADAPLIEWMP